MESGGLFGARQKKHSLFNLNFLTCTPKMAPFLTTFAIGHSSDGRHLCSGDSQGFISLWSLTQVLGPSPCLPCLLFQIPNSLWSGAVLISFFFLPISIRIPQGFSPHYLSLSPPEIWMEMTSLN